VELLEQIRKVREREGASIHELAPVPDSPPDGAGGAARRLGAAPALLALLDPAEANAATVAHQAVSDSG
jgi:hypothetical protein